MTEKQSPPQSIVALWKRFEVCTSLLLTCFTSLILWISWTGSSEMTSNFISFRGMVVVVISVVLVWRSKSKMLIFKRIFCKKMIYLVQPHHHARYYSNNLKKSEYVDIACIKSIITLNSDILISDVNVSLNSGWRLCLTVFVLNSSSNKWVFFRRDLLVSFTRLSFTNGSLVVEYSLGGKSSTLCK